MPDTDPALRRARLLVAARGIVDLDMIRPMCADPDTDIGRIGRGRSSYSAGGSGLQDPDTGGWSLTRDGAEFRDYRAEARVVLDTVSYRDLADLIRAGIAGRQAEVGQAVEEYGTAWGNTCRRDPGGFLAEKLAERDGVILMTPEEHRQWYDLCHGLHRAILADIIETGLGRLEVVEQGALF